jgi:hypothetical protein
MAADYQRSNLEAARVILADPRRYAGLMQSWAHAIIEGQQTEERAWRLCG